MADMIRQSFFAAMSTPYFSTSNLEPDRVTDAELATFATVAGLIGPHEAFTPALREFALIVMERCAGVADDYLCDGPAGNEIRAVFGIGPA
ncbi:MAG: hypothetical protein EOO54_29735 [Haliea sp.]|nr:MAG: hypothetical protein EOO54_29735 [Haliea sp.]